MTLPPALAARLAQRGILKKGGVTSESPGQQTYEQQLIEEIIAEDYDENSKEFTDAKREDYDSDSGVEVDEVILCPNKVNPYHHCVEYCKKRYGLKKFEPDPEIERKRKRMLRKYALPDNWKEIGDPNTNRCYYWNFETDEVSWLPPNHPRAKIVGPQNRKVSVAEGPKVSATISAKAKLNKSELKRKSAIEQAFGGSDESDSEEPSKRSIQKSGRIIAGRMVNDDLDPMDPAAYSDTPRGKWSTGLSTKGKAKTGVDETASGPLFQMRPYPNPGAVLRMNAEMRKN